MLLIENILAKPILEEMSREKLPDGVLCRVSYPICDIGQKNANDRVYEDAVWDKVEAEKDLKEKLENRALFGHAEHPEQTQSNLEKTSHVIFEMWRADGQEWQKFDILDTPTGRIVDCLHRAGCRVGCSTRAEGDLEEAEDDDGNPYQRVVAETYKYVTTDFTADPSTFGSIPYDIKRNIVSEVKKLFENKEAVDSEKDFGANILEGMKCKKALIAKCKKCGCCEALKEKKVSAKAAEKLTKSAVHKCHGCGSKFDDVADLNTSDLCKKCARLFGESKTVESSIKDGIIKEGTKVKYDGKEGKVTKIEEGILTIEVEDGVNIRTTGVEKALVLSDGVIELFPGVEVQKVEEVPELELQVDEPVEQLPFEDEPTITDPGNTGFGLPAVDGEIPEAAKRKGKGMPATASPHTEEGYWYDSEDNKVRVMDTSGKGGKFAVELASGKKVVMSQKDFLDKYSRNESIEVGATVKIEEKEKLLSGEEKVYYIEGKVTKVEESGITIALDDGTVVDIEDPSSVNITVTAPAPALEVEPVVDLPKEKEVEVEPEEDNLPAKEEFESKVITEDIKETLAAGNLLQDKDGVDWIVKEAGDGALVVTQPGEPGTEKRISWAEVGSHGFTKVSEEKVEEKELSDEEVAKFVSNYMSGTKGEDVVKRTGELLSTFVKKFNLTTADADKAISKLKAAVATYKSVGKESKTSEAKSVEKDDGWHVESPSGADLGGPYDSKVEADKRKKDVEFYASSKESKVNEGQLSTKQEIQHTIDDIKNKIADAKLEDFQDKESYESAIMEWESRIEKLEEELEDAPEETDESISTTAKEISDLKVREASTRAERDKAIELIEELTNEKSQLGEAARKEKAFETKVLVGKINKTLEAKELEVDALRTLLEEKAKFAAEVKKQLDETKVNLSKDIKSLNESISVTEKKHQIEADALMEHLQKTTDTHFANMEQWSEKQDAEKDKHQKELNKLVESYKEKVEEVKEEVGKEVKEKVTKEFITGFVKYRLSETTLLVDENSQALLEKCTSIEEVDEFLDEILEASRRGALHSESISSIHVSQQEIVDPETAKAKLMVGEVFEGMNR